MRFIALSVKWHSNKKKAERVFWFHGSKSDFSSALVSNKVGGETTFEGVSQTLV
jgi:hypothetical protein